jgi:threonyl-tRNA synthetase
MLLEHCAGNLALWLAPDQVVVVSIGEAQAAAAAGVRDSFAAGGLRAILDDGPDTLARKIVAAHEAAIPVVAVIGPREVRNVMVVLRRRDGAQQAAAAHRGGGPTHRGSYQVVHPDRETSWLA